MSVLVEKCPIWSGGRPNGSVSGYPAVSPAFEKCPGWIAFDKPVDAVDAADYDVFIVPGGTWNPDTLRADLQVRRLLQEAAGAGKVVAAICHGPWVLSDAGLLKGKSATSWWSMQPDLENAGATFVDTPVVVDSNIITSRAPIDLAPFVNAIGDKLTGAR